MLWFGFLRAIFPMKIYVVATGLVFALLAISHAWRLMAGSLALAENPIFTATTLIASAFAVWATVLLFRSARR